MPKVVIDYEKCKNHGICVDTCPANVFEKQDDKIVVAKQEDCIGCHACEGSCPEGAITVSDDE